jgi:hypothetical protein
MGQGSTKPPTKPPTRIKEILDKYPTFVPLRYESINYLYDEYQNGKKNFEKNKPKNPTGLLALTAHGPCDCPYPSYLYFGSATDPTIKAIKEELELEKRMCSKNPPPTEKELEMETKVEKEIERLKSQNINVSDNEKEVLEDAIINVIANDEFGSVFHNRNGDQFSEAVLYHDSLLHIWSWQRRKQEHNNLKIKSLK